MLRRRTFARGPCTIKHVSLTFSVGKAPAVFADIFELRGLANQHPAKLSCSSRQVVSAEDLPSPVSCRRTTWDPIVSGMCGECTYTWTKGILGYLLENHGLLYNQQFGLLGLEMMRKDENRFPSTVFFFEDHVPHCKLTCFLGGRDEVVRKFWVTGL